MNPLLVIIVVVISVIIIFFIFQYYDGSKIINSYMKIEPDEDESLVLSSIHDKLNKILSESEYDDIDYTLNMTVNPSYAINKEHIFMCLRNPNTKDMYDENTLNYVAIHELAHIVDKNSSSDDINIDEHGESFQKIFDSLIKTSIKLGYYDPRKNIASAYCKI